VLIPFSNLEPIKLDLKRDIRRRGKVALYPELSKSLPRLPV